MSKFKTGLVQKVVSAETAAKEQQHLHEKHHVDDPNIMVVEKSNTLKFTIRTLGVLIRTVCFVILIILAIIGLVALIYPAPRGELQVILQECLDTLRQFLGL